MRKFSHAQPRNSSAFARSSVLVSTFNRLICSICQGGRDDAVRHEVYFTLRLAEEGPELSVRAYRVVRSDSPAFFSETLLSGIVDCSHNSRVRRSTTSSMLSRA